MQTEFTPGAVRVIRSTAPIRICDMGGWTDTWFAGHGSVFHIAVNPGAEVEIAVFPRAARRDHVVVLAKNYGKHFIVASDATVPPKHRLLAAALSEIPPPADAALEITIYSEIPPGCSTGTSASVCVALLAALDRVAGGRLTAHELAYAAHRVETQRLRQQSGIQDQLCAAYGGINFIDIPAYPDASVSQLQISEATLCELERRLVLVYLGRTHSSFAVHETVIAKLQADGASSAQLERLRCTACAARDALCADDLDALGESMRDCTAARDGK